MGIEEFADIPARLAIAVEQLEREFAGIYERSHIESLVHESAEQLKGAAVASFVPLLAHRFARERLRAQAQSEGTLTKSSTEIVFVSITGGGRARMAASLLQRRLGEAITIHTAGSGAAAAIDPNVETAMQEIGIDLTDKYARPLTPEVLAAADVVVTMGHSVGQLAIPETTTHLDWRVGDPANAALDEVRRVRDDIERRVDQLAAELDELAGASRAGT